MSKESFKILSIDGGGIRGIIPSKFLAELEDYLNSQSGKPVKLNEYFDLITGTSTGGIIALGLGLGMSAKDIHKLYTDNARAIFGSPYLGWFRTLKQFFFPKHSRKELSKILKTTFSQYSEDRDTRLGHSKTRLCIPAFNASTGETVVFKTAHHPDYIRDYQIPAYQVALATSAAPTYFTPYKVAYEKKASSDKVNMNNMIDGGIFANNPTLIALSEAIALGNKFEEIKILSIGTGSSTIVYPKQKKSYSSGAASWINPLNEVPLVEMMMQSQAAITENILKILSEGVHHDKNDLFHYVRFQAKFNPKEKVSLDSTSSNKIDLMNRKASELFQKCDKSLLTTFFQSKVQNYSPYHTLSS